MGVTGTAESPPAFAPEIQAVLDQRAGATFLRADLQVHTPIDPAFPGKPEPREQDERLDLARRYLAQAKGRGIQLVGITEHNDVSWIDDLRAAAKTLDLHLLPGFEVESKEGVHVLCLFDPETSVEALEEVLVRLGLTGAKRRESRLQLRADRHFAELLKFVQADCGGICIAAHIESNKGLLAAIRQGARVDAWKASDLLAADVARPPAEIDSGNGRIIRGEDPIYERARLPGYVLTSDARSLDDIGTKSTWIKMDSVGVEGLRQAFLDPASRIAYEDPGELREGGHVLGVAWEGDFLDSVRFPVNPELNALIGGKGTGKSTAIESIRYAFDLPYRTEEVQQAGIDLLEHAFRAGSKVSVAVETDAPARTRYVVERTAPHAPVVRDELGQARPELQASSILRPCIYGQKEIYGIAQDAQARLEMLDSFARHDLRQIVERERGLLDRLRQNGQVVLDAQRRIDDSENKLAELPNLEEWRQRFRKAGFDDLLRERRLLDREERLIDQAFQVLAQREEAAADVLGEGPPGKLDTDDDLPNADLLREAADILENVEEAWEKAVTGLRADMAQARDRLGALHARWTERRDARRADFDRALRELQERMPEVDPERYLDVERRIELLTPLREVLDQLGVRLAAARDERIRLLIDLADVRGDKHRARARAADRLNGALAGNVLIELTYQGERDGFVRRLSALKSGARGDALRRMVDDPSFSPTDFAGYVRSGNLGGQYKLPAGQATALERSFDEEVLLDLEVSELPDSVQLLLDVGLGESKPEYRSLERLSPGQKSTAILLLVMLESKDPLLVDQPEDDLDNRFVYDDVVKRLREAKRSRQFIVATHNANIPILGDAEQIVALDAKERAGGPVRSFIRARGSIDTEGVRDAAEHILEGGREAFELRRKKYSP
jgi:ABC-type Mn2+/Zn2+ transport system ATPase subunit